MKPDPLLDAIFAPSEESFRVGMKGARRRRIRRVLRPWVSAAIVVAILALLVRPRGTPSLPPQKVAALPPSVEYVKSRPLNPDGYVRTTPESTVRISTRDAIQVPARLNDRELLALFDPGRAALVGRDQERRVIEF